jgi:hypothetical protein
MNDSGEAARYSRVHRGRLRGRGVGTNAAQGTGQKTRVVEEGSRRKEHDMAQAQPGVPDARRVHLALVLRDGVVAGLLAALVVATVHFIADVAGGEPLRTPTVLGALFAEKAERAVTVTAGTELALRFTALHVAAWLVLGCVGSFLISLVDAHPRLSSYVFGGFALVYASVLYLSGGLSLPGLPPLHLWAGTLLGPIVAAWYLARRHPLLARHIERVHLSESARRSLERALEHEAADLASYQAVAEQFPGPIFTKMIDEKRTRSQMLGERCSELGLPPSPDPETAHPWASATFDDALREAVAFEQKSIELYDRFLATGPEIQVRDVFLRLRNHILDTTIPELEQALDAK